MNMKLQTPENWQPFDDVYKAFVEANPMLGLNVSEFAATRLRAQYGDRLIASGAVVHLPNRRWFADPHKFGPALFAAMAARRRDILERPKADPAKAEHE